MTFVPLVQMGVQVSLYAFDEELDEVVSEPEVAKE